MAGWPEVDERRAVSGDSIGNGRSSVVRAVLTLGHTWTVVMPGLDQSHRTVQACTGSSKPFSSTGPRSSKSKSLPVTICLTTSLTRMPLVSAADSSRLAMTAGAVKVTFLLDGLSRVDADTDAHRDVPVSEPLADGVLGFDGRFDRRAWYGELRHEGVADGLDDTSAVARDRGLQHGIVVAHDLAHPASRSWVRRGVEETTSVKRIVRKEVRDSGCGKFG